MKKQLLAVAVCGAFCGLAQADGPSVTVSGIIDVGVMEQSKAPNPTAANPANTGSVLGFVDGQILPSIYALRGSEDLGGGLKAGFTLEGGFHSGNGGFNSSNGGLFGREAKMTLGGDWGTFGAGLQVDPALVAAIATEPRGMTDSLSNLGLWIITTVGNTNVPLQGGIFDANSISYTYSGNGLWVGVLYGFGGVAGSTAANSQTSLGASYTNSGITVSAGWVQDKANVGQGTATYYTGNNSVIDFVGVGYAMGPFAGRLQYNEFKFNYCAAAPCGTAGDDVKSIGLGLDWKAGANTLNLAYYRAKDDGANLGGKTTEIALLDTYALSKRTSVYGQIGSLKADAIVGGASPSGPGASIFLNGVVYTPAAANPGNTSTLFGVGMQHSF
jgi:predicted porin